MKQQPTITTVEQLREINPAPCDPALEWLAENNITDLADAWDRCHRSDWMLWLDRTFGLLSDLERRLIACRCVRETPLADGRNVWGLLADDRSRHAVAVAERYADGEATDEQLDAAYADALDAVDAADTAYTAAVTAARTARADAAYAAYAAAAAAARAARADASYAAYAAAMAAVHAATAAAAYASDAMDAARSAQADIVRAIAGNPFRDSAA